MSGTFTTTDDGPQATLGIGTSTLSSDLMQLLQAQDLQPGSELSYELAKIIYTSHPLGAKLVDGPLDMAQSQQREISIPGAPETRLIEAFHRVWRTIGTIGADAIIANAKRTSRIYGISTLAVGARNVEPSKPLDMDRLHTADLYFNVFDPLNTAGSLVLDQDPNSPDFQKPNGVRVGGTVYHPSRAVVTLNEDPIYINWTASAFGFVGRSVYQRALYPLKSYVQTMITNDLVSYKAGVIVAKMKQPTSATNNRIMQMFGWKRGQVKTATTGQVMGISIEEAIESIDLKNLEGPFKLARENILKDISTAAGQPAALLQQETLTEGFGEGSEDAKQIARHIDLMRAEMQPLYTFFDAIVQRIAWSPDFYADLQNDVPEYRTVPYETAFYAWRNAFNAQWPNLLSEPDSEKLKAEKDRFEAATAVIEVLAPLVQDPENKARLVMWLAENANSRDELFPAKLELDEQAMIEYIPPAPPPGMGSEDFKEPEAKPFHVA